MKARRRFLMTLGAGSFGVSFGALGQKTAKVHRIGVLAPDAFDRGSNPFFQALLEGLQKLGYLEGKNFELDIRMADGDYKRLPRLAAELVGRRPDVIASVGTPAILALKEATRAIPIVMIASGDALATGLIKSLASPGGNITGATFFGKELMLKRLQLLKDVAPQVKRVAVFANPDNQTTESNLQAMRVATQPLGIELLQIRLGHANDLAAAFEATRGRKAEAVAVFEDAVLSGSAAGIADFALQERIPAVGYPDFADRGGLIGYGANFLDMFRRAGYFIDRVLRGEAPASIAVERPTTFDLVVNVTTARRLGLRLPQSLLAQAGRLVGE